MCTAETVFSGHITHYDLVKRSTGISPACHYLDSSLPAQYGAMNEADYQNSAVCGACVEITNPSNNVRITIPIVDECPATAANVPCQAATPHHVDLSPPAYDALSPPAVPDGRPPVTWRYVPCAATTPIQYFFDPGSNPFYISVTIVNTRYRVAKVEVLNGGQFQTMNRSASNQWEIRPPGATMATGAGPGPFTFRVTDIYNHVLQDTGIALMAGQVATGTAQFPACP
jgi:expansin (peptidoglycan-binding protein)